jgi:hypothetical protein
LLLIPLFAVAAAGGLQFGIGVAIVSMAIGSIVGGLLGAFIEKRFKKNLDSRLKALRDSPVDLVAGEKTFDILYSDIESMLLQKDSGDLQNPQKGIISIKTKKKFEFDVLDDFDELRRAVSIFFPQLPAISR